MCKKDEAKDIKGFSLEESFDKIDEIMEKLGTVYEQYGIEIMTVEVKKLDLPDDNIPLEESFELYKEGMDMLKHCREVIDDVEKKVIMLSENGGNNEDEE